MKRFLSILLVAALLSCFALAEDDWLWDSRTDDAGDAAPQPTAAPQMPDAADAPAEDIGSDDIWGELSQYTMPFDVTTDKFVSTSELILAMFSEADVQWSDASPLAGNPSFSTFTGTGEGFQTIQVLADSNENVLAAYAHVQMHVDSEDDVYDDAMALGKSLGLVPCIVVLAERGFSMSLLREIKDIDNTLNPLIEFLSELGQTEFDQLTTGYMSTIAIFGYMITVYIQLDTDTSVLTLSCYYSPNVVRV